MKKLVLLFMFLSQPVFATDFMIKYGLGTGEAFTPDSQVKNIGIGIGGEINQLLCWRMNGGGFFDNRRNSITGYGFVKFGPMIKPAEWFWIENTFGPGFITRTDDILGSIVQFNISIGVGFRDPSSGVAVGLNFIDHISNTGIKKPNRGRDFLLAKLIFPI